MSPAFTRGPLFAAFCALAGTLASCTTNRGVPDSCSLFASRLDGLKKTPGDGLAIGPVFDAGVDCASTDLKTFRALALSAMDDTGTFAVWTTFEHDRRACAGELMLAILSVFRVDQEHLEYRLDRTDGVLSGEERSKTVRMLDQMRQMK